MFSHFVHIKPGTMTLFEFTPLLDAIDRLAKKTRSCSVIGWWITLAIASFVLAIAIYHQ